ncbi:hypothetical protein KUTeg_010755 [Tegillarca granosa]|uniref:Glycosyltransferase 2-like domain-containing protein n=1 Tax=Tegillarca granosa TaxID=220873 RepID=A0ABQ9F767_TEGGR|nr:hypothetical protein KUTeg_010755 [Tegillarca granosa]
MLRKNRIAFLLGCAAIYFLSFNQYYNTSRVNTLAFSLDLDRQIDGRLFAESLRERIERTQKFLMHDFEMDYVDINAVTLDDDPCIDLRIIVIVYDRAESMKRLLNSLNEADYLGDCVILDIWIDRSIDNVIDPVTYKMASEFTFKHGICRVHNQTDHVGIYGQWMKTWHPADDSHEIAVFLEDDLTVSPYFYKWLKAVHKMYDDNPYINGYSLYSLSVRHKDTMKYRILPNFIPPEHVVYLYPLLATWGFSPSKQNWMKFISWFYRVSRDPEFQPIIPGLMASAWYQKLKERNRTDTMWSMWHIYYAWKNSEFTMHPNLPERQSLAVNWKEPGLHVENKTVSEKKEKENFDFNTSLLYEWDDQFINFPENPLRISASGEVVH